MRFSPEKYAGIIIAKNIVYRRRLSTKSTIFLQGWDRLYQGLSQLKASTLVSRPIALLKLRRDGLLYRGELINCQFVYYNEKIIRKYLG